MAFPADEVSNRKVSGKEKAERHSGSPSSSRSSFKRFCMVSLPAPRPSIAIHLDLGIRGVYGCLLSHGLGPRIQTGGQGTNQQDYACDFNRPVCTGDDGGCLVEGLREG